MKLPPIEIPKEILRIDRVKDKTTGVPMLRYRYKSKSGQQVRECFEVDRMPSGK